MLIQLPRAAQAFASDVNNDNQLSWDEFSYWAEYQPQFSVWLQRLGIACLEAISPLEDRNVQHSGQRPVQSTYRVRRKFPLGTQFDKLRVGQVRNIFMSYSTYGKPKPTLTLLSCLSTRSPRHPAHTAQRRSPPSQPPASLPPTSRRPPCTHPTHPVPPRAPATPAPAPAHRTPNAPFSLFTTTLNRLATPKATSTCSVGAHYIALRFPSYVALS